MCIRDRSRPGSHLRSRERPPGEPTGRDTTSGSVSYTHLDVYKRQAPGGPEIQKDNFAAEVGKARGLAVDRVGKIFCGASAQAGFALAVVGTRKQEK